MKTTISVTEVRNSLRCPRLFLLGRRFGTPARFPVGGSALGGLFHRIVERLSRMAEQPPAAFAGLPAGVPVAAVTRALSGWLLKDLAAELDGNPALRDSPAEVDDLAEALRNFTEYVGGLCTQTSVRPTEALGRIMRQAEVPVSADVGPGTGPPQVLEGRIDALFEPRQGEVEVIEYKLSGEETEDLDRAQVSLYRFMARQALGLDAVPVILRFTPSRVETRIERAEADRLFTQTLQPHLARMFRLLDGEEAAAPAPGAGLCPPCPLRAACLREYPTFLPARDMPPAGGAGLRATPEGGVASAAPDPSPPPVPTVDEEGRREAETFATHVRAILRNRGVPAEIKPPHLIGPTLVTLELVTRGRGSVGKMDGEAADITHRLATGHGSTGHYEKAGARRFLRVVRLQPRTVDLRQILSREARWLTERPGRFVLGETPEGDVLRGDLADPGTPHLLVGGQTGSGKSVLLRALVRTMVHFHSPAAILITLVDPKRVTFTTLASAVAGHLSQPVCHDIEAVVPLLGTLADEMESRYELFEKARVDEIQDYNAGVPATERLPRHVVVVDEFQDLLATKKTAEIFLAGVQRLGAKARAAGIHLILATQRPDAKTIPGGIKANLGGRIALKVASAVNSRIILDEGGAEDLLGTGDLLANLGHGLARAQAPLA